MERSLTVTVDHSSWSEDTPPFPQSFHRDSRDYDFNIPALLLALGYLTTPPRSSGASLSEYWAWVRYFCAISDEPDLRLTREFSELDPHQKTILSDDFGMAIPMYWLIQTLGLGPITDGRYFIDCLAPLVGANTERAARRGPSKSPDFVAQDAQGYWHVIECKGTQSGIDYRDRQLGNPDFPVRGAVSQKRTVTFPGGSAGQRLACGLFIAFQGDDEASNLKIIDPSEEETFPVLEDHIPLAVNAMHRAVGGRALLLSGFRSTSSALINPSLPDDIAGLFPEYKLYSDPDDVAQDSARVLEELQELDPNSAFSSADDQYYGRDTEIELPRSIDVKGTPIRRVRVRHGVNLNFLNDLARNSPVNRPLQEAGQPWHELMGKSTLDFDSLEASFTLGSLFVSEVRMRR